MERGIERERERERETGRGEHWDSKQEYVVGLTTPVADFSLPKQERDDLTLNQPTKANFH